MMKNYFNFEQPQLLLKGWKPSTIQEFYVCLGVMFTVGVAFECLKSYEGYLKYSLLLKLKVKPTTCNLQAIKKKRMRRLYLSTFVFIFELAFGYFAMLCVMTFQVYIILAIVAGISVGYFISNPLIMSGIDLEYMKHLQTENILAEHERHNAMWPIGDWKGMHHDPTTTAHAYNDDNPDSDNRFLVAQQQL